MGNASAVLQQVVDLIRREKKFILATHVQPDGDAIGSLLGLTMILKKMGKEVFASWGEPINIPSHYSFLPGTEIIQDPSLYPPGVDNFIALDCATLERLGNLAPMAEEVKNLVSIDHHAEKNGFAAINLVDPSASSTAELVFRINKALDLDLTKDIATCLYVGLVTDTGRFQYSNTTRDAFAVARELVAHGVSPHAVFQQVYENITFAYLKLLGLVLDRTELQEDCDLIYTWILQSDLQQTGAKMSESENLINSLRSVKGIEVAAVIKELEDGRFNVSLRSKGKIRVDEIAEKFGGGGHPNAAGYRDTGSLKSTINGLVKAIKII